MISGGRSASEIIHPFEAKIFWIDIFSFRRKKFLGEVSFGNSVCDHDNLRKYI